MFKYLEIFIALKILKHKIFRTLSIVLAIGVGISVQLFVGIIIDSSQNNLITRTLGSNYHLLIKPFEDDKINTKIKNPEKIINNLNLDYEDFTKIAYLIEGSITIYDINKKREYFGKLIGIKEFLGNDIYNIQQNMIDGKYFLEKENVVIGNTISEKLKLKVGDYLVIKFNNNYLSVKILGIFNSGNPALDNSIIMNISQVQDFLGYRRKEVSSIFFQVKNVFASDKIKEKILSKYDDPYEVLDWKNENKQLLRALSAQRSSGFFVQFFILLSITISVFSIINMKIMEKYKEIGILKAIGMKNKQVIKIFLNISLILGILGIIVASIISLVMTKIFLKITQSPEGKPLFEIVINYPYIFITILLNIFSIFLAGYLSSKRISKIEPAQIIIGG
ncbi:MAG: FtsX-like permease family protein [Patescibacteria group bacterium]|nr:FtsX-like permease family protein [Patescibacteria group bacterium]